MPNHAYEPGRVPGCAFCGSTLDYTACDFHQRDEPPCEDARDHLFSVQQAFFAGACTVLAVLSLLVLAGVL